ncbi:MAG TPA: GNAT family N-acetyltransferase [Candidatus Dormibacteraeota bacterium]|nr:GNAT family N-acetyltransferase [Candidatus Dormibacteraeota bacterium]
MFRELFRPATGKAAALQLGLAHSLREVEPGAWAEASQSCGLYLSYPFLLAVEESSTTPPSYLLLRDATGQLVAGLPLYLWNGEPDPGLDHYEPFGSGARWVLGKRANPGPWLPTLLAGTRSGYSTEFAIHPGWKPQRQQVVARLLGSAAEVAEERGVSSLGVMWLTSAAAREAANCLTRPEYLVLAGPNSAIEIVWNSFDGYLAELSSSRRKSFRRERERFRTSGLRTEYRELSACLEEVAPLAARLQKKYGHALSALEIADQLQAQARHLDAASRVILCRRQDQLVGFALFYSWRDCLYGRLAGFDYPATADTGAYFNLAFYLPLQLALEEGLAQLKLGMASWRAKALRGAHFDPAWNLSVPPGTVRGAWAKAAQAQEDGPARWWASQFPSQVDWKGDWRWTRAGLAGNSRATSSPR